MALYEVNPSTLAWVSRDPYIFAYVDPSGTSHTATMPFMMQNVVMYPFSSDPGAVYTGLLQAINLPDGTAYQLTYEPSTQIAGALTGRLASIGLPNGGAIGYTYQGYADAPGGISCTGISQLTRTTIDGITTYSSRVTAAGQYGCPASTVTTVQHPDGSSEIINFQYLPFFQTVPSGGGVTVTEFGHQSYETSHVWYSKSGAVLKSTMRCYNGATGNCVNTAVSLPITQVSIITTLDNGQTGQVVDFYDAHQQMTEEDEYGFGSATPDRKTVTTYAVLGNNILDRASSTVVYDRSGTVQKKTTYGYDESPLSPLTNTHIPNWSCGGPTVVLYACAPQAIRGNLTSKHEWSNASTQFTSTYTYDVAGQLASVTDPKTNTTSYTYDGPTDTFMTSKTLERVS